MKIKFTLMCLSFILINTILHSQPIGAPPPNINNTNQTSQSAWYRGGNNPVGFAGGNNIFGTKWNSPIYTQTFGITRTRLNGNTTNNQFGFIHNVSGYFGIAPNGYFNTNNPISMLHLEGGNNTPFGGGGQWRDWMKTGTFYRENSDAMYVGLKEEGFNESDAVVSWSDDTGSDQLRFIFTSTLLTLPGAVNPLRGDSRNGYEFMRMTTSGVNNHMGFPVGYVGIGPLFTNSLAPQNRLHINAESGLPTYMQITNISGGTKIGTGQMEVDGLKFGIESLTNQNFQTGFLKWQENSAFVIQTEWDNTPGGTPNGFSFRTNNN